MKLLETGVPDTIREAPCYVADLPQLGDDADSGLYICEIIGRLLRGQPLDFHEGDFDVCFQALFIYKRLCVIHSYITFR